jgi:hypothetical protein
MIKKLDWKACHARWVVWHWLDPDRCEKGSPKYRMIVVLLRAILRIEGVVHAMAYRAEEAVE